MGKLIMICQEDDEMGITYFEKEKVFKLDTENTSYVIAIVDKEGFPTLPLH